MRKLVLLLAAALALTACTAAPEVSSPAEAAPPAETAAIGEAATAFPVGTLQMAIPEVMDTGAASVEIPFSGLETEPILKLDYAAGVQTKLCDIDLSRQIPVAIMQHGDTAVSYTHLLLRPTSPSPTTTSPPSPPAFWLLSAARTMLPTLTTAPLVCASRSRTALLSTRRPSRLLVLPALSAPARLLARSLSDPRFSSCMTS